MEELLHRSRMRTQPGTPLGLEDTSSVTRSTQGVLEPKSYLTHPGVVASSIFAECLNFFLAACMKLAFYVARWTFSKHHNIEGYKGAVAASHIALAPSSQLDTSIRYGAQSDFFAREYVFSGRIDGWESNAPMGAARKEKAELLRASTEVSQFGQGEHREGDYVRALARDLIIKCEGTAKRVWREAREGALPPFSQLDQDGFPLKESPHDEQTKKAILSASLLPSIGRLTTKDDSLSSQEDWEKVDETV